MLLVGEGKSNSARVLGDRKLAAEIPLQLKDMADYTRSLISDESKTKLVASFVTTSEEGRNQRPSKWSQKRKRLFVRKPKKHLVVEAVREDARFLSLHSLTQAYAALRTARASIKNAVELMHTGVNDISFGTHYGRVNILDLRIPWENTLAQLSKPKA